MSARMMRLQVWWHEKILRHKVKIGGEWTTSELREGGFSFRPALMRITCGCGTEWEETY